jgi:hypothetical protein
MSGNQITKKLTAAGIDPKNILEVSKDEVEVGVKSVHGDYCEYTESEELANRVFAILGWKNGMKTGYNSWVIEGHSRGAEARLSNAMDQFGAGYLNA